MSKLTAIITTVRHGKKDSLGKLEEEGKKQSANKALDINHLKGDIILFHSGEQRVRDTISLIGGNIHKTDEQELINFLDEEHDLQDYLVPTLHFLKNKNLKSDYFSAWSNELNNEEVSNFINIKDNNFNDYEKAYSAEEMARNLGKIILTQINFATLTSDDCRTNFINGTHEPVIMSFLYYLMTDFNLNKSSQEFVAEIGGSTNYAEGFDIEVFQNNLNIEKVLFKFRKFEKEIDLKELQKFVF